MSHITTPLTGFGSYFESSAIEGALPIGQNSPQNPPFGLYAEQINGSAFTAPRSQNFRSWLYRIRPSVVMGPFEAWPHPNVEGPLAQGAQPCPPDPLRWGPLAAPKGPTHFIQGLHRWAFQGSPNSGQGGNIYLYAANRSMDTTFFYNSDGQWLIIPQQGKLHVHTEFGSLEIAPGEIALMPRGVKFQVQIEDPLVRGYVCENFGAPFMLPELGPIGANGLANPRDFQYPDAHYTATQGEYVLINKFEEHFFKSSLAHHPLDVVAWHGNYAPCKYDLRRFNTINTVSFDHPDPSIFTVLTSQTNTPGVANIDFVIFPERWMVAENTFRPPYYHRNIMSEFMGLISGAYDAKPNDFLPGGASLHNRMTPHGPDSNAFEQASQDTLSPFKVESTLAFMLESQSLWIPTQLSLQSKTLDTQYLRCWKNLDSHFKAPTH